MKHLLKIFLILSLLFNFALAQLSFYEITADVKCDTARITFLIEQYEIEEYILHRRTDETLWVTVGSIPADTINGTREYIMYDRLIHDGKYYYQLESVTRGNHRQYSGITEVYYTKVLVPRKGRRLGPLNNSIAVTPERITFIELTNELGQSVPFQLIGRRVVMNLTPGRYYLRTDEDFYIILWQY